LYRLPHLVRKTPLNHLTTSGAPFALDLMLGHFYLDRWQVKHLPLFHPYRLDFLQVRRAVGADVKRMPHDVFRFSHHLKRLALVSGLSPSAALPLFPAAARARFLQPIAAGWFPAVLTVLRQLVSQLLDLCGLLHDHFSQFYDDRYQALFVQSCQLVVGEAFHDTAYYSSDHLFGQLELA
jgi:hypothetical protein